MKRLTFTLPLLIVLALASGCVVHGSTGVRVRAHAHVPAPTLVYVQPGVQVVADYHEPVFYSEGYYWRYYGGVWYRSSYHHSGWVRVRSVPVYVSRIDRPHTYVRYRAGGRAHVRSHDRGRPVVRGHVRGGGRAHVRSHDRGAKRKAVPARDKPRSKDRDHRNKRKR